MRLIMPRSRPTPASSAMMGSRPTKSAGALTKGGSSGAIRNETSPPSATRSWTGKLRIEKSGKMDSRALTRTNTIIQLVKSKENISSHHLRQFFDDHRGELNHRPQHPWQQHDEQRHQAKGLGHKAKRLLMNGSHCLKEADEQPDDHRSQQNRKGERDRLEDSRLEHFDCEFRCHDQVPKLWTRDLIIN